MDERDVGEHPIERAWVAATPTARLPRVTDCGPAGEATGRSRTGAGATGQVTPSNRSISPVDVGEALASYLRHRPRDESRALFLRVIAPAGPLRSSTVRGVVHDACVRAGVPPVGAHRLRHTAATGMLREGASLSQIAQVLRHREIDTTARYAKVDRVRLRALA